MPVHPGNRSDDPAPPAQIHGRDTLRDRLAGLVERAQHEILVFAPRYERALFDTPQLAEALAHFVTRHRQNRARLLVEDAEQLTRDNERLMEVTRKFSDFIEFRQVAEEHRGRREIFAVVDRTGFLHQEDIGAAAAIVHLAAKSKAAALAERFEALWTHGTPLTGRLGVGR